MPAKKPSSQVMVPASNVQQAKGMGPDLDVTGEAQAISVSERRWLAFKSAIESSTPTQPVVKRSVAQKLGEAWAQGLKKGMYKTGEEWGKAVFEEVEKAAYDLQLNAVHVEEFKTRLHKAHESSTLPPHEMMAGLIQLWRSMHELSERTLIDRWMGALPLFDIWNSDIVLTDSAFSKQLKKAPKDWQLAFIDYVQTDHHHEQLKNQTNYIYSRRNYPGIALFGKIMSFKYHRFPEIADWANELSQGMTLSHLQKYSHYIVNFQDLFDSHVLFNTFKDSMPDVVKSTSIDVWQDFYSFPLIQRLLTQPLPVVQQFRQEWRASEITKKALLKYWFDTKTIRAIEKESMVDQKKIKESLELVLISALFNTDEYFNAVLQNTKEKERCFESFEGLASFADKNNHLQQNIFAWFNLDDPVPVHVMEPCLDQYAKGLCKLLSEWSIQTNAVSPQTDKARCGPAVLTETLLGLVDVKATKTKHKSPQEKAIEAFALTEITPSNFWSLRASTNSKSIEEWIALKASPDVYSRFTKKNLEKNLTKVTTKTTSKIKKRL